MYTAKRSQPIAACEGNPQIVHADSRSVSAVLDTHHRAGRYLDVAGVRCFLLDHGSGPAVVCLHGVPTSSFLYRKVVASLARHGCRAIAFDFPGLGFSGRPGDFDYSFSGLMQYGLSVVNALGLSDFHLVVHDIGGPIGFAMASHLKDRIRSLTILNTWIDVVNFRKPLPMRPFSVPFLGEMELATITRHTWYIAVRLMGISDITGISREEIFAYVDLLKRDDEGRAFLRIARGFDSSPAFRDLCYDGVCDACYPVQAIWGEGDWGLSFERYGREIQRIVRPGVFYTVKAKHLLQEDKHAFISEKIRALMGKA